MNFTNEKIDDELCKNLVENQDLLLSSNLNETDLGIDFFSMMPSDCSSLINFQPELPPIINDTNMTMPTVPQTHESIEMTDQLGLKDEIIDSDIFEFLRSEDPDVVSLIESLSNSESVIKPNFLPQISVNTTNSVLNSTETTYEASNDEKPQQYSIVHLTDTTTVKQEVHSPPQPDHKTISGNEIVPSRVSQRLIKRRGTKPKVIKEKTIITTTRSKKEPKRLNSLPKTRKASIDEDSGSLFSNENSNDNNAFKSIDSVGYESDEHIYFDDDDFTPAANENSNEREFQEFVLNYNHQNADIRIQLDPTKKDANKEAATRYRLKKLSEKDQMFETRMMLEKENDEVKRRCELVNTEINYLKNLMVQMLLSKGVVNDKISI